MAVIGYTIADYVMAVLVVFLPTQTASVFTKGRIRGMQLYPVYFYLFTAILLLQWLCKNGLYYFTGIHLI
jgi:hypothetical protein